MKNNLLDLLSPNQLFTENEQHLKYKFIFLNRLFLIFGVMAIGISIYRWQAFLWANEINFGVAAGSLVLFYYLRRNKDKVEVIGTIAIVAAYIACYAIYLLALDNRLRIVLFFPLVAGIFYLKGVRTGLAWLFFIIFSILAGLVLPGIETGYASNEIVIASLYLFILFFIIWNYEMVREQQQAREQEYELQKMIDGRWRLALEGVGDAIWDWNIQTGNFIFSKSYADMLGYTEAEIGQTPDHLESLLHPDDMAGATAHLNTYLAGESNGQYVSEQRLRCKDGSYKWILCRGRVTQRDEDGRPQRIVGTHVDITERKLSEQALRESNERLRSIFEHIPTIAVQGYLSDGTIVYWNPASERVYGYSREEAMGENLFDLVIPDQLREQISNEIREMAEGGICYPPEEFLLKRKDGTPVAVYSNTVVIRQPGQETVLYCLDIDLTEHKEHEKQLEHIAHYDALTGVPNRVLLADRLSQALARTKRDKGLMAVCYLDLDGFKPINDSFGHDAGDKVLVEVTRRIKEAIREDDTVARLGGDEFVVLLVGMQVPEECVGSLNRLLESINQPIEVQGQSLRVSASIGVSLYPEDDQDTDTLLRHADQAMYVAKQSGKNRYHLFDAASDQRARSHHALLQQIRQGMVQGEFELYYQPKIEMQTRRLVGAEALIRWNHPQRGLLPPSEFLRIVENTELEIELGDWVIVTAIDQLRRWRESGFAIEVSINVSAYHLQSPGFVEKLKTQANLCCPGNCLGTLQVEVLETAALEDIASVSAIIKECKAFGMGFALDDFGTGYSSLSYLSKFDVDVLKIDQSFVRDMLEDKGDHAIVLGIIALARAFDMGIVAEGVETDAQYRALLQMGCEVGQGYGIAYPMRADELIKWRPA